MNIQVYIPPNINKPSTYILQLTNPEKTGHMSEKNWEIVNFFAELCSPHKAVEFVFRSSLDAFRVALTKPLLLLDGARINPTYFSFKHFFEFENKSPFHSVQQISVLYRCFEEYGFNITGEKLVLTGDSFAFVVIRPFTENRKLIESQPNVV